MKKAVLLIAALLMVGSLAFAAPGFGIWGRTEFQLAGGMEGDDTIYQGWGPTWSSIGPRMGIHTTYSNDKMEFKTTFYFNGAIWQAQTGWPSDAFVEIVNMYGTLKFVPDLFSMIVGKVDGDGFDTYRKNTAHPTADMHNANVGRMRGWGLIFVIAPADTGFDAALQLRTPPPDNNGRYAYDIEEQVKNISLAASYKVEDLIKISAGYVNYGDAGDAYASVATPDNANKNIFARVELLMVPDLTLWVDARFFGFETDVFNMEYLLYAGYKMDALALYLGVGLGVADPDILGLRATLEVTYNLGFLTLGAVLVYVDGNLDVDGMDMSIRVYGLLNDFAVRLAFEYNMIDMGGAGETSSWSIPLYFTFSIW